METQWRVVVFMVEMGRFEVEGIFCIVILLIYIFAAMYVPRLKLNLGHQTGLAVLLGILAGYITSKAVNGSTSFDENIFFYFVLPPIIFAEGYNMKRRRFFQNFSYIALFGILGTIVNFVINVLGAMLLTRQNWIFDTHGNNVRMNSKDLFLISAVLSASDTVAAVSIIEETEAPKVHSILLGEGVMNDAVSIILFNSAKNFNSMDGDDVPGFIGEFLYDMIASIAIGLFFGVCSAVLTKHFKEFERHPPYETALLFFLSNFGYLVTLVLGLSGVISILVTGIVMGHYTWYNLSKEGRVVSRAAFQILGELLEAYVFVYVGLSAYNYSGDNMSLSFIGMTVIVVMVGRFVAICGMSGAIKLFLKKFDLKWKELLTVWFAGSIRGAIAFALILTIPENYHFKELMKTTILGVVLFTTVVFGSIMPLLKKLVVSLRHSQILRATMPISFEMMSANNDPMLSGEQPKTKLHKKWRNVDDHYLKRWLIKASSIPEQNAPNPEDEFHMTSQEIAPNVANVPQ